MNRRLPIYLLLDTSGSMTGEPIAAVENGLQVMLSALRSDPHALETAYLSVITFDSDANQIVSLTDLASFQEPSLTAQGTTSLGEALTLLSSCIDREVNKSSPQQKGDWKPIVFIMTDGMPTDDWQRGWSTLQSKSLAMIVACAAGGGDLSVLQTITENVVSLDTADKSTISQFFKWVSSTITSASTKVDTTGVETTTLNELPPPPKEVNIVI